MKLTEEYQNKIQSLTNEKLKGLTDKEITELIYKKLWEKYRSKYSPQLERQYIVLQEARIGTGYTSQNMRSCDFMAISSNNGNDVIGYEVKASRSDFLTDIKNEAKQKALRCFTTYFYYVAPRGVIGAEELPPWAGLYELSYWPNKQFDLTERVVAPRVENLPPTWSFVAACIRNSREAQIMQLKAEIEEKSAIICKQENELKHLRLENWNMKDRLGASK